MNLPDLLAIGYGEAASARAIAPLTAFAAGVVTSVGPCVAPRYLALAALAARSPRDRMRGLVAAFAGGIVLGYVALGLVSTAIARIAAYSSWIYALLAVALGLSALASILVRKQDCCARPAHVALSASGAFLLGCSSALVLSPCCTPFVLAVGGLAAMGSSPLTSGVVIAAYACGHTVPLLGVLSGGGALERMRGVQAGARALASVGGGLTLALACYYGLLV